jgi:MOSC domain-containing protein YiiM
VLDAMQLESINVGRLETIDHNGRSFSTGICKYPVNGSVRIEEAGVCDDVISDVLNHGGADQAIYVYSADDYDWWASQTERDLFPGLFGENLTIRGMPPDMNVGDRLLIGEAVLEATAPRIPCSTFAAKMQDSGFGLTFRKAERPGVYFRVLNGGDVSAGDNVTLVAEPSNAVSILELFRFNYLLSHDEETLKRYLEAPVAVRFRNKIESKLKALDRKSD